MSIFQADAIIQASEMRKTFSWPQSFALDSTKIVIYTPDLELLTLPTFSTSFRSNLSEGEKSEQLLIPEGFEQHSRGETIYNHRT